MLVTGRKINQGFIQIEVHSMLKGLGGPCFKKEIKDPELKKQKRTKEKASQCT